MAWKHGRARQKPPPYLGAARQEPSPTSGHLTSRLAILSTRTREFGPERAPVGEGARRRARARRGTNCSPAKCLACRHERRLGGLNSLQVHSPRRGDVFLGACRRGRRLGGLKLYQLSAAWGATGQLSADSLVSGIWLGLWASTSGDAAQSTSPIPHLHFRWFKFDSKALGQNLGRGSCLRGSGL